MKSLCLYALLLLTLVLPLLIAEFVGCNISGHEFSPDDFSARTFSYRRSPLSGYIRSERKIEQHDLDCTAMIDDGYITVANPVSRRWDLFHESMQYSDVLCEDFDARFLTHFLDYNSQQWTKSYPKKAALLWPEIANMARDGLYLYIPEIMLWAIPHQYEDEGKRSFNAFEEGIATKFTDAYRLAAKVAKANQDGKESQWLQAAKRCEEKKLTKPKTQAEDPSQPVP